ncbi:MAG TPA: hypothetical protein VFG47_12525 [Geminicoccaceae bacterium]|nr:hypothetical protein [Geminicoccaceae bacterium]
MPTLRSAGHRPDDSEAADQEATELALCVLLQALRVNPPTTALNPEEMDAVLAHLLSRPDRPAARGRQA